MRRETKAEREAWTAFVEGHAPAVNKYGNERSLIVNGRRFDSKHEANEAMKLDALERFGKIKNLRYQVPFVLVEGRGKIQPIKYVADFVYADLTGRVHVVDAKGCKTPVYRLKRKLAALLHGIEIEEI